MEKEDLKVSMDKILEESNKPNLPEVLQNSLKELYQDYAKVWNTKCEE